MAIEFAWLLAALGLLAISLITYRRYSRRLNQSLEALNATAIESLAAVERTIANRLRPSIHLHDSEETVTRRAADVILAASQAPSVDQRAIYFFGAASLSASKNRTENDNGSAEAYYNQVLDSAAQRQLQIRRYISLLTPPEVKSRNPGLRNRYLQWLRRQHRQLIKDDLYQLIDVVRAPKWGANMARIISAQTVMEITGNGQAAVIIDDEDAAKTIREFATRAVLGDETSKNRAVVFSVAQGQDSVASFRLYVESIERAIQEADEADATVAK